MSAPLDYPELIELEALMQLMLQAAQSGNWTVLSDLDEQRKVILEKDTHERSDVSKASFTKDSAYTSLVETIKKLDNEIITVVERTRNSLASENKVLRDQVKAKAIYQQASTMGNVGNR